MDAKAPLAQQTSATAAPPAAPTPVLDYQPIDPNRPRRWSVGTLTYTTAGLIFVIAALLVGDIGISVRDRASGSGFSLLLRQFKASNIAFSFLMTFLPQGIAMVVAPTISFKSDRFRSRWGRRIPFLLLAAAVGTVGTVGIAFSPRIAVELNTVLGPHSPGTTWCGLTVFGIFWVLFQFSLVCAQATSNGLINDVIPRPVLGRFFGLWRGVSLVCGMVFNFLILGHVEAQFQLIFLVIGLIYGGGLALMCLTVREGSYPPVIDAVDDFRAGGFIASVRIYFRDCFSKPYYRWVFAALALGTLTAMPVNTFSVLYAKSLNVNMGVYGKYLASNHFCGFLLAFPIGILVDRFHTLRVSMVTIGLYGLTMLLAGIFIRGPQSLLWAVFFQALISGTYITASLPLAQVLLPRLKFAQFYSASLVLTSVATMVMGLALGYALDYTGSNYRLTYFAGFGLAMLTLAVMAVVHQKFMARGGPKGYVAPDDEAPAVGFPVIMKRDGGAAS